MHTITAKAKYTDEEIKKLEGYFVQNHHIDKVIDYDCDAYKENGEPFMRLQKVETEVPLEVFQKKELIRLV